MSRIPLKPVDRLVSGGSLVLVVGLLLPFAGVAGSVDVEAAKSLEPARTLILVSLDGTRPADLTAASLPTLVSLADRGLRAERMIPVFPSNTFPNHVTLVTGVEPERHGIVNNSFTDPGRGVFRKQEIPSWIEVEPIWSLLERRGVPSASYHWVGSEGPWPGGGGPAHWKRFDPKTPEMAKVEQILEWLQIEDPCRRPRFVTTWFHGGDHAGHVHGPGSEAVRRSLRVQDQALARLWSGLAEIGIRDSTILVFVSDHGMAGPRESIDLATRLAAADVEASVFGTGGFAIVDLNEPSNAEMAKALDEVREAGLRGYRRAEAPASLAVDHERFGDIVVVAPSDIAIVRPGLELRGYHGYSPKDPAMSALFVVAGPGVPPGRVVPVVRSLDVAPTLLALLGVEAPEWVQGRPIPSLEPAYRKATPPRIFAKLQGCAFESVVP